jgi:hypothetical protein
MYIRELRGTTPSPVTTSGSYLEIDVGSYGKPLGMEIVRISVKQTAGSATNFIFSIGNKENFTTNSIHEKYLSTSISSSGVLDETSISAYCMSSDSGKLYFKILPNSGSDNEYVYSIMFKRS